MSHIHLSEKKINQHSTLIYEFSYSNPFILKLIKI